uniref:Venom renin-receptor-like protein 1 n=1 Tax=Pristhesancus plagipennis TaxID=1955184 RepID=A0A2K8JUI7_PRIPG|nr:venom renin-receptor-like protein 1 [Pristhesancus plagipennis]
MLTVSTLFVFTLFVYVNGAGEISILQTPDSLSFVGQEQLDLSNVKNLLSSALGFTVPEIPRWSGMVINDPFHFADAVVVVSIPGVPSLDSVQGKTYPLNTDESLDDTWRSLSWRLIDRFPTATNLTLNYLSLDVPTQAMELYGHLGTRDSPTVEHLKLTSPEDKAFIDQVNLIDAVTAKLADKGVINDGVPDAHWFSVPGLHALIDTYGAESKQVIEAKRLLSSSILLLSEVFNSAYNDKVLFVVLSSDVVHTRRFRRQATASSDEEYDENYPVMFNIFLWFGICYFMALLATSLSIARMDPGRDSIIYRMTSNRMKKEN